jgi:hypothetical protein
MPNGAFKPLERTISVRILEGSKEELRWLKDLIQIKSGVFCLAEHKGALKWSGAMRKSVRKNPHAVALGRLGGLVHSEAKQRANRENGRKGGLAKSRRKTLACRRNARRPRPGRRKR